MEALLGFRVQAAEILVVISGRMTIVFESLLGDTHAVKARSFATMVMTHVISFASVLALLVECIFQQLVEQRHMSSRSNAAFIFTCYAFAVAA